jgi:hypothetical protein
MTYTSLTQDWILKTWPILVVPPMGQLTHLGNDRTTEMSSKWPVFFFTNGWDMFFSKGIYRNGKKNTKVIESQWKELSTAPFPHEFSITPAPEQVSASSTTSLSRRSQCEKWKVIWCSYSWLGNIYIYHKLSIHVAVEFRDCSVAALIASGNGREKIS